MARQSSPSNIHRRQALGIFGATAGLLAASSWSPRLLAADSLASKRLVIRSETPFNAEPELPPLVKDWITPHRLFYVRNHGTLPKIEESAFKLSVTGLVNRPVELSLAEIQALGEAVTIPATLTCAGNRRVEFKKIKAVGGVQWDAGAIGNANWTGIRLATLLAKCGVRPEAKHVWFEGLDSCKHENETTPFGASIPIARALAADPAPAMLAWKMNGEELTPEHGFPLRGLVPGYIGARSVKWLSKIVVSDRPSPNYFQSIAYKLIEKETDSAITQPIYDFVINSVICTPLLVSPTERMVEVAGYALPNGAASKLAKVEVSADGGRNWTMMKTLDEDFPGCWRRFAGEVRVPDKSDGLVVRATDFQLVTQPQTMKWNLKGYLYNAWHGVPMAKSMGSG